MAVNITLVPTQILLSASFDAMLTLATSDGFTVTIAFPVMPPA
jgi:hypothetical protein